LSFHEKTGQKSPSKDLTVLSPVIKQMGSYGGNKAEPLPRRYPKRPGWRVVLGFIVAFYLLVMSVVADAFGLLCFLLMRPIAGFPAYVTRTTLYMSCALFVFLLSFLFVIYLFSSRRFRRLVPYAANVLWIQVRAGVAPRLGLRSGAKHAQRTTEH